MRTLLFLFFLLPLIVNSQVATGIPTDGHSVYHVRSATIDNSGIPVVVGACFDGTVICYKPDGTFQWKTKINNYFPFDLAVFDIDDDGHDEIFVATGGGTLDAYRSDGSHLWTYQSNAQLYQVCLVKTRTGKVVVLTGGIEEKIFLLDIEGNIIKQYAAGDVVRHIRKGDFYGSGEDYVAVATTSSGRNGILSLLMIDPLNLDVIWKKSKLGGFTDRSRFMSMIVHDINGDGKMDVVVSGSWEYNGRILAYDNVGNLILTSEDKAIVPNCSYRMLLLTRVKLNNNTEEYIFGLYANYLIIYNKNGIIQKLLTCKYDFTNLDFDTVTNTLLLGSSVSGGGGIYTIRIDQSDWQKAFESIMPVAGLAEIENNMTTLQQQLVNFQLPSYQKKLSKFDIVSTKPSGKTYQNLSFNTRPYLLQIYENRTDVWCKDIDLRYQYNRTADEIVNYVIDKENKKESFYIVSGHGTAVYMPLETMKRVIAAGPNYFKGFVFSELQSVDSRMQEVIEQIYYPLASECSKAGKKIIFEQKNIFWGATCYVEFWNNMLLNPEFHDVFVPALEESNSRTQEISLAGRIGLSAVGVFDKWQSRTISDNPCFDRMWEWSSPQILSHYLRHQVYTSSMGAGDVAINIQQGPLTSELYKQLLPLYDMYEKGVVAVPGKGELLSVPDICLAMKSPPSKRFLDDGINSHGYTYDKDNHSPKVFDRLGTYWGGAQIADHDFSGYGYGCERRMLNFLPVTPFGLVAIIPETTDLSRFPYFREKVITDGECFYDSTGFRYTANEYKPIMLQKLQESASRLPVLVKGDVAWSVVRIDSTHIRITLVDPGYTDPAEREVEIILQHLNGIHCRDIIAREDFAILNNKVQLTVPIGLFRIVDIEHAKIGDISAVEQLRGSVDDIDIKVFPNPGRGKVILQLSNSNNSMEKLKCDIYNASGVRIAINPEYKNERIALDMQRYPNGIYTVRLYADDYVITKKIILCN